MDINLQPEASQLLQWREERKLSFLGTLLNPDGTIIPSELEAARDRWRKTRTVRTYYGDIIELPRQMSEWDVCSGSLRAFYAQYPECVNTVAYSPGEPFIEALARQAEEVKRDRTLDIQRRMIVHIEFQQWHLLQQDINDIFAVDPLNRPHRPPTPEEWSIPETAFPEEEGEMDNEDGAAGNSTTAPFQPFDPDFDWGTLRRSPDVSIKVKIKKEE